MSAGPVFPERFEVSEIDSRRANGRDWDAYADEYQATHGEFLQDAGFVWGPEGIGEPELGMLGDPAGKRVLEVGCGAAQCSRYLAVRGAQAVGLDLAFRQLQHSVRIDQEHGVAVPVVLGTATSLPFGDASFDVVFSSFGALQFVADLDLAVSEAARVLRPGGRFAFSITHPTRWAFPDDPSEAGLTVGASYFDRTPYVEVDDEGAIRYVEHHRTLGDWFNLLARCGFAVQRVEEPQWPEGHERIWGGWGPLRGKLIPGTLIVAADLLPLPR